ncbi:TBC1 domain family member 22B-like, partial [Rhincodon typus]|uniref:TBC1 domain family member 22B-like n=1 Tax=Rhincodon typus TaxID=259920 RepID=UPI00202EA9A5
IVPLIENFVFQDNYTFAQPGIQRKVKVLQELVSRIDEQVHKHLQQSEVEYLQFAFRWMNNLLMRELPLRCTIRLWDTYQSEPDGFSHFHLYVCAAFLVKWRKEILEEKDFQGLMILLQNLPTMHWGNEEISVLLAEAYRLKYAFADAPNHYKR